jgi:hypothetical protein
LLPRKPRVEWSHRETLGLVLAYERWHRMELNIWSFIKSRLGSLLAGRTNVNIKDKYRNLSEEEIIKFLKEAHHADFFDDFFLEFCTQ